MNTTKLVCPKCGSEIAIPEHSSFVAGIAIGKDSNLGTIELPLAEENDSNNVGEIVNTINSKGTSAFPVNVGDDTKVGIVENGTVNVYDLDDPVIMAILNEGTVPNHKLFRRNVLAMLMKAEKYDGGIHYYLKHKGYEYMIKMLTEEYRVQVRLHLNGDKDNFYERNCFFNKSLAFEVANDYLEHIKLLVDNATTHRCRGRKYITLGKYNVFVDEINNKVLNPLMGGVIAVSKAQTPIELAIAFKNFRSLSELTNRNGYEYSECIIKLDRNTRIPEAFVNAYKGVGGYAASKNMILFSNARCFDKTKPVSEKESMHRLDECRERALIEGGYLLYGFWRELFRDNKWNIDKKFDQWHKEKMERLRRNRR